MYELKFKYIKTKKFLLCVRLEEIIFNIWDILESLNAFKYGRSSRIRTYDPLVPNQVHYQAVLCSEIGVNDGIRTRDNWNHNPGLYQLSYIHHQISSMYQATKWRA